MLNEEILKTIEDLESRPLEGVEKERLVDRLSQINHWLCSRIREFIDRRSPSDPREEVTALTRLAQLYTKIAEWEKAISSLEIAESLYQANYLTACVAQALKTRGKLLRCKARWDEALKAYRLALSIYEKLNNKYGLSDIYNSMAITNFERGNWDEAEKQYLHALDLIEETSPALSAKIYNNLGALYNARGNSDKAISTYLRSIPDFERSENILGLAQVYNNLGMSFANKGDWQNAASYYEKSLQLSRKLDEQDLIALTYLNLAQLHVNTQSPAQAQEYCKLALGILQQIDDQLGIAEAHKILGVTERLNKNWSKARYHFEQSIMLNEKLSSPLGLAEAYLEFGLACKDAGKHEEAHSLLSKSLTIFEKLKAKKNIESVRTEVTRLDKLYLNIIEALGAAVENKDPYTMGHSSRVAYYSLLLAKKLMLPPETIKGILIAAYLHDIGKIYVEDEILNKPGKLTSLEFEVIKRHPEMGVASLSAVEFPWEVKQYILHHHERYDGSGYPCGLKGDEIPIGAQIIAIADFFDAMTSERSYRPAWSQAQAISIIVNNRNVLFGGIIVDTFVWLVEQGIISANSEARYTMPSLWEKCSEYLAQSVQTG